MNIKDSITYLVNCGVREMKVSERDWQQFREDLLDGVTLIPANKTEFLGPSIKELVYRGIKISVEDKNIIGGISRISREAYELAKKEDPEIVDMISKKFKEAEQRLINEATRLSFEEVKK